MRFVSIDFGSNLGAGAAVSTVILPSFAYESGPIFVGSNIPQGISSRQQSYSPEAFQSTSLSAGQCVVTTRTRLTYRSEVCSDEEFKYKLTILYIGI